MSRCGSVLVSALLFVVGSRPLPAQRADDGRGIALRIHPRVGDTLHTRLDQQTEVSAVVRGAGGPATRSVTTSVALITRTIVQSSIAASTTVLTVVDSAAIHTSDAHGVAQVAEAERVLRGRQMILQIAVDGSVEDARDPSGGAMPRGTADAMSAMPAVFPRRAVSVGEQWTREMPLPTGGPLGTRSAGHVNAVFRFDSLGRSGTIAFISMRGEIISDTGSDGMEVGGSVRGTMQVDRVRGWLTDSYFTVAARSMVTPPSPSRRGPIRFDTRVTQRLRTMDKR